MKILIADDDPTSTTMVTLVLEKYGHEVVVAKDGAEAWEVLQRPDAPRLVILDWMMPGPDGLEICRRVRALTSGRQPYILMLTALGNRFHVSAALDSGANDYLRKPFAAVELRARVAVGERSLALEERLFAALTELALLRSKA
jgi:DNA-binding response OmpR family regulator